MPGETRHEELGKRQFQRTQLAGAERLDTFRYRHEKTGEDVTDTGIARKTRRAQ